MELVVDGSVIRYRHHEHFRKALAIGGANRVDLILSRRPPEISVTANRGVFTMRFPTRRSLKRAVSNWKTLHGLALSVNGRSCGVVHRNNPELY